MIELCGSVLIRSSRCLSMNDNDTAVAIRTESNGGVSTGSE